MGGVAMAHEVMSPRLVLGTVDAAGNPYLPEALGPQRVWDWRGPTALGPYAGYEYRNTMAGWLVAIIKLTDFVLADATGGALSLVWVLAPARDGQSTLYAQFGPVLAEMGLLRRQWFFEHDKESGALLIPALDADRGPEAEGVRRWWPDDWRVRLRTDDAGDLMATPPRPPAPPTGPRMLGAVFA